MTNSEARDLMAQNSHDVTILDGEDAEAISVVNIRGQENQFNNCNAANNRQEIVNIGDSNEQITLLNAGCNSMKNEPIDGIEILDEKDIRILGAKCLESDRLVNGITPGIFEQDKIYDYHNICAREFCSLDSQTGGPTTPQDNVIQISNNNQLNSMNKTTSAFNNSQGNSSSIQKNNHRLETVGSSLINYNFHGVKQNPSTIIEHGIISNDNVSGKNQSIDILGNGRDFQTPVFPCEVIKTEVKEVKILGPKNQNKIKIVGQEKILQLDKSGMSDTVKILGNVRSQEFQEQGDEFKDFKILGGCGYEQFITGSQSTDERGGGALVKKEVKILGKKKESSRHPDFEVSKRQGQGELNENTIEPTINEPDSETYLSLLRINTWLRKSC